MTADTDRDVAALRKIGHICWQTLNKMKHAAHAGMTTGALDDYGRQLLEAEGARSAPEVMYHYPGATCISVSPVIAHGIPGDHVLTAGELIHVDVSAELDGYYADTGESLIIPDEDVGSTPALNAELHKLLEATRATLHQAVDVARAGRPLNAIGRTVQSQAQKRGYQIIPELTGHGIGHSLHEAPDEIWNVANPRDRRILKEGAVLAIEPFLTTGLGRIREMGDGWSLRTADNAPAAQFEHTIIVRRGRPLLLTV
jgi:methionyl aminopeptidase